MAVRQRPPAGHLSGELRHVLLIRALTRAPARGKEARGPFCQLKQHFPARASREAEAPLIKVFKDARAAAVRKL